MHWNTLSIGSVKLVCPWTSEMNVAPLASVVLVQVPSFMDWNSPLLPWAVQPIELVESPGAPMSDETTAMCTFGRPFGSICNTWMNSGS